jgi:hypothetical protein
MPSSSGFSVEAINMRIHQRRNAVVQPLEWMKEVIRPRLHREHAHEKEWLAARAGSIVDLS